MADIELTSSDITTLEVDVIVNAANTTLLGGGGVDGAIHRAAGPRLRQACAALPEIRPGVRCPVGDVRVTDAFDLPATYVFHTVGPSWGGGAHGEAALLDRCYRRCLELAGQLEVGSIAFPAISCGAYGFPVGPACEVALRAIESGCAAAPSVRRVALACVDPEVLACYRRLLGR